MQRYARELVRHFNSILKILDLFKQTAYAERVSSIAEPMTYISFKIDIELSIKVYSVSPAK